MKWEAYFGAKHKKNEHFKEKGIIRAGEDDNNANGDGRMTITRILSDQEELQTQPNAALQIPWFRRNPKVFVVNIKTKPKHKSKYD